MTRFTIPNRSDALPIEKLSWPYSTDIAAMMQGIAGEGVWFGCEVSQQASPAMGVSVAVGSVVIANTNIDVDAADLASSGAHTIYERCDLVVVDDSGTPSIVEGTADAAAAPPSIPADSVLIGLYRVPANATMIVNTMIVDKAVIVKPSVTGGSAILIPKLTTETIQGATFQDDDELQIPVAAHDKLSFTGLLFILSASNTAHMKVTWDVPSGTTMRWGGTEHMIEGNVISLAASPAMLTESGFLTKYLTNQAEGHMLELGGRISVGSAGGLVKLRWAQLNAQATDLSVLDSSSLEVRPTV